MVFRGVLVILAALACKGEPKRSYCEALCDWAVACHETERTIDSEATLQACLDSTSASDKSCERAETGKMDPASKKLLEPCVKAIDEKAAALECDGFVGRFDDLKLATVPASCATQGDDAIATFDAARDATVETNEELCGRFSRTLCRRVETCIVGDAEIPQQAIDAAGGTPFQLCVDRLDSIITADCISNGLYEPEDGLIDANIARQSARECLTDFDAIACEDLVASPPQMSPACAGSFSNPDDLAAVGGALLDVAEAYADF